MYIRRPPFRGCHQAARQHLEVLVQKPSSPAIVCFKSLIHPKGQPECLSPAARKQEFTLHFLGLSIPGSSPKSS